MFVRKSNNKILRRRDVVQPTKTVFFKSFFTKALSYSLVKILKDKSENVFFVIKWLGSLIQFLREVKNELKKVVWPSRRQTFSSTGVIIILMVIITLFLGLVDLILVRLVHMLIG